MILTDMLYKPGFDYIKLEPFTGSYNGMRYRIWTVKEKFSEDGSEKLSDAKVMAAAYPEPYSFEMFKNIRFLKKTIKEFDFSKEGLEEAIEWLSAEQEKYV